MKTCLITGANSGIGRQAAEQIANKGWRVILVCRNEAACKKSCDEIIKVTGNSNVYSLRADLSNIADIRQTVKSFHGQFNELDVLINNAADFDLSQKHPLYTVEGYEKQFTTNVLAPFLLTKELLPTLLKSEDGRIINISSQGLMLYPAIKTRF
jgi:NAD(P)-dependent dehydrogenase (short-subunit alcohol dehydrogenase family)